MIRIPQVPGLQPTAINSPQVDPRAAAVPWQALGNVAESIAGVSEDFHDAARKVQLMENGRIVSEKRQALASNFAALQLDLQKDPDPASRINRTKDFFSKTKGEMETEELPDTVRAELLNHFDNFATEAVIRQGEDSFRLAKTRGLMALDNELNSAIRSGNPNAIDLPLQTARESGFVLPEQEASIRQKYATEFKVQEMLKTIQAKPLEAEKALNGADFAGNHPDLDPATINRLQGEAERTANRFRSDFTNDLIISGANPTPEELKSMESSGQIDKDTHARWITRLRNNSDPVHDPALYEEAYDQVIGYDPAKDASGQSEAAIRSFLATQNLPAAAIKTLNDKLNERIKGGGSDTPKGKLESEFASRIHADFNQGTFGHYRFPLDHDNSPGTAPIMAINSEQYGKSWQLRGEFAEQWRGIMSAMPPNADFTTVSKAYNELKEAYKNKRPTPTLNLSKPVSLDFDPNATLQNIQKSTFGGQPVRPPGGTYTGAIPTVFGGKNDPADNGKSAFGGETGDGAKQGTAIPKALLDAKFPGKDKSWLGKNVRTVVRGADGRSHVLPVVDLGTAEWVWQKNGRPTLDLTEGAARQIGAKPTYDANGKMKGLTGVATVDFTVVSIETSKPLAGSSWEEAKRDWFATNKPRTNEQASNGLIALRQSWHLANAELDEQASVLPPKGSL